MNKTTHFADNILKRILRWGSVIWFKLLFSLFLGVQLINWSTKLYVVANILSSREIYECLKCCPRNIHTVRISFRVDVDNYLTIIFEDNLIATGVAVRFIAEIYLLIYCWKTRMVFPQPRSEYIHGSYLFQCHITLIISFASALLEIPAFISGLPGIFWGVCIIKSPESINNGDQLRLIWAGIGIDLTQNISLL